MAINPHDWTSLEPQYLALENEVLTPENVQAWLLGWNELGKITKEAHSQALRKANENTSDEEAEKIYLNLIENVFPKLSVVNDRLNSKLLAVGHTPPPDQEMMMRRAKVAKELFREANVPIHTELAKLGNEYDKIIGTQMFLHDGREQTLAEASVHLQDPNRELREKVWRTIQGRTMQDRDKLNALVLQMMKLRRQVAANAGFKNYLEYAWQSNARFDYTPADSRKFHEAIEKKVVPLASKLLEEDRTTFAYEHMRPWDFDWRFPLDPNGGAALKAFSSIEEFEEKGIEIFRRVDPELGAQFEQMRKQNMLDLGARKGKAPGGYCNDFPITGLPYIFQNAVGTHDDVQTLLHEGGHAFHCFAFIKNQTLIENYWGPTEFAEVGSMAMELLAAPHLEVFYNKEDAKRARVQHLRGVVRFLPYMAIMDAFQHWLYVDAPENVNSDMLDVKWSELWDRFSPGVDWENCDDAKRSRWQRQGHIFTSPLYYIEYGMAQIGALQVWKNSHTNPDLALQQYKQALTFGGTKSLPELFSAAGAKFVFDASMVGELMDLIGQHLEE